MKLRALVFLLLAAFFSCKESKPTFISMRQDVEFLASDSLQGRKTGTTSEQLAAAYISQRMRQIGLEPKGNAGTYLQTFSFKPRTDPHQQIRYEEGAKQAITGTNVIGYLDNKADKTVVIGAHYDHLGLGGEGSLHRGEAAVHNGADDNASGVALMLDLAGFLRITFPGSNYLFIAFSGEEMGLLGSNYFAKNPTVDLNKVNYMLNLDMVGRLRENKILSISGTGTTLAWEQVLKAQNPGFKLVLEKSGIGPSDHTSFYLQQIPALHFFTGSHKDYHRPSDDADKLNYEGMELLSDYIIAIISELDDKQKLPFTPTKNESQEVPRFKVTLGVVPDYLFDGKGMRIDGISEGRPAEIAGLEKGDVVVQLGDSTVVDMMSYMRALSTFEEGDATTVVVDRMGQKLTIAITF